MEIVRAGGQVVVVAELTEKERDEIQVLGIDVLAAAEQRFGHHATEIEDGGVEPPLSGALERARGGVSHLYPIVTEPASRPVLALFVCLHHHTAL